jgi:WD40 repeat protein
LGFCDEILISINYFFQVRTKNKPHKEFGHLFLAQKISLGVNSASPPESAVPTTESMTSLSLSNEPSRSSSPPTRKKNAVWAMRFSNNGRYLAAGGQDGIVRVWVVLSSPDERSREAWASYAAESGGPASAVPGNMESPSTSTPKKEKRPIDAPVFASKPLHEFHGHAADVLDLSWSKVSDGC